MDILWTSKYAPDSFSSLKTNKDLSERLKKISHSKNTPHIIFYGPDGGGKRCRINCLLSSIYGRGVFKTTKDNLTMKNNNKNIEVTITRSHINIQNII